MTRYARLEGNRVIELVDADLPLAELFHPDLLPSFAPIPADQADSVAQGWTLDGETFAAPPPSPPPPAIRSIRSLAFRQRVPAQKRVALSVAAAQAAAAGNGQLLTFILDQAASITTNLDDPQVAAGVAALLGAGLLTAEEAAAMTADGTADEV